MFEKGKGKFFLRDDKNPETIHEKNEKRVFCCFKIASLTLIWDLVLFFVKKPFVVGCQTPYGHLPENGTRTFSTSR